MSDDIEMVKRLHATTDASVWTTEFLKVLEWRSMHDENVLAGKEPLIEEGWMIGWFANAIEVGRDAGRRSLPEDTFRMDAERYRWLRDRHDHDDEQAFVYGATGKLDEYIDEKMKASARPQLHSHQSTKEK